VSTREEAETTLGARATYGILKGASVQERNADEVLNHLR